MTMIEPSHPIAQLLADDKRYTLDAYIFVFEALNFAHNTLGMGGGGEAEKPPKRRKKSAKAATTEEVATPPTPEEERQRHLTGQQLCEAIRQYALEQFGLMAKCVFNSWGIHQTGDFGEIVFNLIKIEQMHKTKDDRREDFDDVFDFDRDLTHNYKITLTEAK